MSAPENAAALIRRAQAGDEAARETLARENMALVKSIVRGFLGRGVEFDDLLQTGSVGLLKAIDRFDTSLGLRFSTYAVPMIAGEIRRFLRDDGAVKVSRGIKEAGVKVYRAQERLKAELGRAPTLEELASDTGIAREELALVLEAGRPLVSLDAPVYDDGGRQTALAELIGEDGEFTDKLLVRELISRLDARERQLVTLRFFMDKTQSEIGRALGISQVQVSRLLTRTLKKLREGMDV